MAKPVISVENLSKVYRLGLKEEMPDTLVGAMTSLLRSPVQNFQRLRRLDTFAASHDDNHEDSLWALKDVSFDVHEGDVVGIIGRNGAGKSTLLKILSRITEPTSGRVVLRGRVSSLLEVGTGFHPELTGRENVYMNGTILGMTKREIDRKFDEIVDFSGVERFLDTPVKRYSSGMQVRLAFAVAAHLEPEILIIDEVLAVGDAEFQKKCLGKMQDVAEQGRTVLFVSHNLVMIKKLCKTGILFEKGKTKFTGLIDKAITQYLSTKKHQATHKHQKPVGELSAYIESVKLLDSNKKNNTTIKLGGSLKIELIVNSPKKVRIKEIGIGIDNKMEERALSIHTPHNTRFCPEPASKTQIFCTVENLPLPPGEYDARIVLRTIDGSIDILESAFSFEVVELNTFGDDRQFHRGQCVAKSIWSTNN